MIELANRFKALADETRLRILALLLHHGEVCVCDVEQVLGITQSKSSRHLRYLLHTGLAANRREGQWMYYRLPDEPDAVQKALIAVVERVLPADEAGRLKERLEAWRDEKARSGPVCPEP